MNERSDNHKALQQLSRMERFALMYGHPLKAMKEEHPKETAYRETEELVEANVETEEEKFEAWFKSTIHPNPDAMWFTHLLKLAWLARAALEEK